MKNLSSSSIQLALNPIYLNLQNTNSSAICINYSFQINVQCIYKQAFHLIVHIFSFNVPSIDTQNITKLK